MSIGRAKAFPSPISTGIDIARIDRFVNLIKDKTPYKGGTKLDGWANRVLNVLEEPQWKVKLAQFHGRPRELALARWMSGRWAMKEAAIKAHTHRRLFPRQISIMSVNNENPTSSTTARNAKPKVLIDPAPRRVWFLNDHVRRKRGLKDANEGQPDRSGRWAKITMEARQLAEGSISHDGNYAIAVCQALDMPCEDDDSVLLDEGTGEAIHEPEAGDEGWQWSEKGISIPELMNLSAIPRSAAMYARGGHESLH